jgi:hypothetical protein
MVSFRLDMMARKSDRQDHDYFRCPIWDTPAPFMVELDLFPRGESAYIGELHRDGIDNCIADTHHGKH